jgi:hypothetical protein
MSLVIGLVTLLAATSGIATPTTARSNPALTLAVQPKCGTLSTNPVHGAVTSGLRPLKSYKTIISFGVRLCLPLSDSEEAHSFIQDGFADTGARSGSSSSPAVVTPPSTLAGGRMSNGPVWVEDFASDAGADLASWAQNGTTAEEFLIPNGIDVRMQTNNYITTRTFTPAGETLHVITAGAIDTAYTSGSSSSFLTKSSDERLISQTDTRLIDDAAGSIIYDIISLSSYPAYGTDFLVIDNSALSNSSTPAGTIFRTTLLQGLNFARLSYGLNVGYVDLAPLYSGIRVSPGPKPFGLTSGGACLTSNSNTVGQCMDPATMLEWMPG